MRTPWSLATRAILAVVLMAGFYLLALAITASLFCFPIAEVVYLHQFTPKLDLICVLTGAAIIWSVLPRIDRFKAPGPLLTPGQHARLFKEIQTVAGAVGQAAPAEVYLVPDVNAWVAQRGGMMGFGSRRVMGLGLPLMRALTRSQFRAVLAHEFGHYHGGDTRLGPWIYKTRTAIIRTLSNLGRRSWIQKPFLWYGKVFLRVTHAISRRQEFVADELAARTVGAGPLIAGLRTIHGAGAVFGAFWQNECVPILQAGFRPPLAEGFSQFLRARPIEEAIKRGVDNELRDGKANPYDTHPPLKERIAAVEHLPVGSAEADDPPALSLLSDAPALEKQLLLTIAPATAGQLMPIGWQDVCTQVYLPQWTKLVQANTVALKCITPESLPRWAADRKALGARFVYLSGRKPDVRHAEGLAGAVIGAALVLALVGKGFQPHAAPGENVSVTVGSSALEPFGILDSLAKGRLKAEEWQNQVVNAGIAGADLSRVGRPSAENIPPVPPDPEQGTTKPGG